MGLFGLALDGNPDRATLLRGRHERPDPARRRWAPMPVRPRSSRRSPRRHGSRRRLDALDVERPRLRPGRQPLRARRQAADLAGRARTARPRSGSPTRGSTGFFGFAGGPLGGRIDPTGQWLYFSITVAAEFPLGGRRSTGSASSTIRRRPTSQLVHRFPAVPEPRDAAAGDGPRVRGVGQPLRQPARARTRSRSSTRPATRSGGSPTRGSTRRGASRSSASRCWSRTATSNRATTRTPGRSSRSTSARRACRSTNRGCRPAEAATNARPGGCPGPREHSTGY